MAASAKDVLQQFYVELIQKVPLDDDGFFAIVKTAGLLPLDTGERIKAEKTRAAKVSYLLSHVVEPGAKDYLPILLKAMEDSEVISVVNLAQEIRAALGENSPKSPTRKEDAGDVHLKVQRSLSISDEDPVIVDNLWSQEDLEKLFYATKDQTALPKHIQDEVLQKVVVLLVVVNVNETLATCSYLEPLDGHENIYKFSKRDDFNQLREVATYYIGKYGVCPAAIRVIPPGSQVLGGASSVPRMALGCFPHLGAIIGVGVACGVEKKVKMCDVLVSSKVVNYDQGRIQHGEFTSRGQAIDASVYLHSLLTEKVKWPNSSFIKRLEESKMHIPKVKSGVILSGPYLLDDSVMKELLIKDFAREAIGVEMEGAYLFAASRPTSTDVILVKAVCDFGDGKKDKAYQPTAALMAADWVHKQLSDPQVPEMVIVNKGYNMIQTPTLTQPPPAILKPSTETAKPFDCKDAAEKLKKEFPNLLTLPYSAMKGKLFSKDVITFDEIVQIDALVGQAQMQKLFHIVLTSLSNNQAAKYKGFLQAMEESDDILLQMKAKELGGSGLVPDE